MTAERRDGMPPGDAAAIAPVRGNAWLIDGDNDLWLLAGPDPAGTGMAVYQLQVDPGEPPRRALYIEDQFQGIARRGPEVILPPAGDVVRVLVGLAEDDPTLLDQVAAQLAQRHRRGGGS